MLGGAKKVFDSDGMNIDMDGITVAKLTLMFFEHSMW